MTIPRSILFVCLGNICRSPSAEAVMRAKLTNFLPDVYLDSAGTAGYHIGNPPDPRAITTGESLGFELSRLRARQVSLEDFYEFELIFAMDDTNLSDLQTLKTTAMMHAYLIQKVGRLLTLIMAMSKILSKCTPIFSKLPIGISRYGSLIIKIHWLRIDLSNLLPL